MWFSMRRRFTIIYSVFLEIRNRFFDIKKSIHLLISKIDFFISKNRFLDINKFLDIKKWNFDIKKKDLFLDIKKSIFWYQEIIFFISKTDFLISRNAKWIVKRCRCCSIEFPPAKNFPPEKPPLDRITPGKKYTSIDFPPWKEEPRPNLPPAEKPPLHKIPP